MRDTLFPIVVFFVAVAIAVVFICSSLNRPTTIICPDGTSHTIHGSGTVYCK